MTEKTLSALGARLLLWESSAKFLHAQKNDKEGAAHDKLPPVEVGRPFRSKEVAQLLMYGVMPWIGNRLGRGSCGGRNDILGVAKQVLDLQRGRWAWGRSSE